MAGSTTWTVGFKKAATWRTAVALGALNKILLESESLGSGVPEPIKDANIGDSLIQGTYQGNISCEGNIVMGVRYAGFERLLGLFMGDCTVNVIEAGVVWEKVMRFAASNDGYFGTLAIDKGVGTLGQYPHEYPTCKIGSLELNHNAGKLMATLGMIANRCDRTSTTNGATEFAALTTVTNALLVLFTQLTFRVTEKTGAEGNLSSSHDLDVAGLRITANRNISGDQVTGANAGEVDEPTTDGLPEAQLILNTARYSDALDALIRDSQEYQTAKEPKRYKAEAIWTGPEVPTSTGPEDYILKVQLPDITIANAPTNAGSPGAKVPVELTYDIVTPQATVDGTDWSWVTAGDWPFRAVYQTDNDVNPLT